MPFFVVVVVVCEYKEVLPFFKLNWRLYLHLLFVFVNVVAFLGLRDNFNILKRI